MQSPIHEGYEYQDYFTVSIILQLMLKQTDAEIIIDRKDFSGDKFDDLKVKTPNGTTEFQIKYSDDEYSHKLAKDDFANGNGHDTALCDLFASWKTRKESENDTQIKLCLAWNRPDDDDPIVDDLVLMWGVIRFIVNYLKLLFHIRAELQKAFWTHFLHLSMIKILLSRFGEMYLIL